MRGGWRFVAEIVEICPLSTQPFPSAHSHGSEGRKQREPRINIQMVLFPPTCCPPPFLRPPTPHRHAVHLGEADVGGSGRCLVGLFLGWILSRVFFSWVGRWNLFSVVRMCTSRTFKWIKFLWLLNQAGQEMFSFTLFLLLNFGYVSMCWHSCKNN